MWLLFLPSLCLPGKGKSHTEALTGLLCPTSLWSSCIGQSFPWSLTGIGPSLSVTHYLGAQISQPTSGGQRNKNLRGPSPSTSTTFAVLSSSHLLFRLLSGLPKCRAAGTRRPREFARLWVRQNWTHSPCDLVLGMYLRSEVSVFVPLRSVQLPSRITISGAFTLSQEGYWAPYMHCFI